MMDVWNSVWYVSGKCIVMLQPKDDNQTQTEIVRLIDCHSDVTYKYFFVKKKKKIRMF